MTAKRIEQMADVAARSWIKSGNSSNKVSEWFVKHSCADCGEIPTSHSLRRIIAAASDKVALARMFQVAT